MNFDYDAYEKSLRLAFELLEHLHAEMNLLAFKGFESELYLAIAETYQVEIKQVREDMTDFQWMLTESED
jgi:hypothetical protein